MSLVLLKNLLLSRSPRAPKLKLKILSSQKDGAGFIVNEITSVPSASESTTSWPDVEAQKYGAFQSRNEEPVKGKKFKIGVRMISDAIIGLSDGMTVPFALTAGLSALGDTRLVVIGGLAELVAGAISMGLGGFIGAKSEAESYDATVAATQKMIEASPGETSALVHETFQPFALSNENISQISQTLHVSPMKLLDFLMRFHHQMPEPATSRPFVCGITIALGYFIGGFVPLIPYFCVAQNDVLIALWWSIGAMAIALFAFGWVKTGVIRGWRGWQNILAGIVGGLQMVIVGGVAAGAAVGLVRAINRGGGKD